MVTDYLEDSLPARDRTRLEAHLADCPHCSTYFEQIRQTLDAVGHIEPDDLSAEALDDLVSLYRGWRSS